MPAKMPTLILLWVWLCAYLNCVGWGLSALHQLNPRGYGAALVLGFTGLLLWRIRKSERLLPHVPWQKLRRRFRRLFPAAFLILAGLAILGGVLHPPNNYDEMTYRFPRVLHWLAEGHWHWIHTPDPRMNDRASGFEWLTAPLFAVTQSDRLFFLPNAVSFLLLPGLIYSVFIRLGVSRRAAWHWMWLLPAGFNFVLQAGSVANDLFGVAFALAALDGALRFGESRRESDLWLSILAAGLMTGAKISNVPLLLPWFGALLFAFRGRMKRPVALAVVGLAAILSSCLPNALMNIKRGNDWTGSNLENPRFRMRQPLVGIAGNTVAWGMANLTLPIMPFSHATGEKLARWLLPRKFPEFYNANFESDFINFWGNGIQTEDGAGLGMGIWCLWFGSALASLGFRRHPSGSSRRTAGGFLLRNRRLILRVLLWISLLIFMAKAGMGQQGRLISPYYPLLIPLLLASPAQEWIVRQRWWRWSAVLAFGMAGVLVVLAPARPLLPAQWLLCGHENNAFLARAEASFIANAHRGDELAPVRVLIPPEVSIIGFCSSGSGIEPSLWRPFGRRQVECVLPADAVADLRRRGIEYVVFGSDTLEARHQSLDDWLKEHDAEKVGQVTITRTFPPYRAFDCYVARLRP